MRQFSVAPCQGDDCQKLGDDLLFRLLWGRGSPMKVSISIAAVAAAGIAMSGCASIVRGSSQSIAIATPPTTGANCVLSSSQGNWTVVSPGAVTVERSKDDVQIRCTKPGYQDGFATIPSNFEGWTLGNLILGGVIGVGVDAATGAINQYPKAFQVPMIVATNASATPPGPPSPPAPVIAATAATVDNAFPHPQPPYPDSAQANGEQGVVKVDVYVRSNGRVTRAKISQSSGYADLDTAALQGVLNWRFIPGTANGEAVSDWTTVKVVYQLPTRAPGQTPTAPSGTGSK